MMVRHKPNFSSLCKGLLLAAVLFTPSCAVNPATGQQQFTLLMPPGQEAAIGAQEHQKVLATFGSTYEGTALQSYVNEIGQRIAADTERPDVQYRFHVVDSPMVNAFAIPGGYIYVTRGLMALANNEAELAAVLAHEVGHITGRHSAERYSHGVLASLGGAALATALQGRSATAAQAVGLGTDLYISSYSRGQEHEADALGVRYLSRANYDPMAMAAFLRALERQSVLENQLAGRGEPVRQFNYFSSHPQTADRVVRATSEAQALPRQQVELGTDRYLNAIDGMVYGDSAHHGFVRERNFWHPQMGFTFAVPSGFSVNNQPDRIVLTADNGAVVIFDGAANQQRLAPMAYLRQVWLGDQPIDNAENITINGMAAATASFPGTVNNRQVDIRLVAVQWRPDQVFRFQIAIPRGSPAQVTESIQRTTYSLRPMTDSERQAVRPDVLRVVTARQGDTVASLARQMPFTTLQEERFRVLNGMDPQDTVVPGRRYKVVTRVQ